MADYDAIVKALGQTWPARMAKSAAEALMLPGDVYQGNVSMYGDDGRTNPEVIGRSADLAGLVTGGSYAAPAMKDASGMGIRAYHGSPHDFDRFDMSKIGTGEGAQAYGHGLYFADQEATAKAYRDALVARLPPPSPTLISKVAADGMPEFDRLVPPPRGKMYEVNINADPAHFLDWDKPLAMESAARQRLKELGDMGLAAHDYGVDRNFAKEAVINANNPAMTGEGAYRSMIRGVEAARPKLKEAGNPRALFGDTSAMSAEELKNVGIPGIKYLDQGSRGAGQGSSNYVVFNDKLIEIMKKYGIALPASGAAAAALYDPNKT